jgi:lantibiotic modifying enzyme
MLSDFYGPEITSTTRLLNTGLLAANKKLSGIFGGGAQTTHLGMRLDSNGNLNYTKKNEKFHNRLHDEKHKIIETSTYEPDIRSGFLDAYLLIMNATDKLRGIIDHHTASGLTTRVLVRTTAHYKVSLDMMYSVGEGCHRAYLNNVTEKFSQSATLIAGVSSHLISAEVNDLLNGDIPFFLTSPKGGEIWHSSGVVMNHHLIRPLKERISSAVDSMTIDELDNLRPVIDAQLMSATRGSS